VANQYARAVSRDGNRHAQELMATVFAVSDRKWRGLGPIPASGLSLRDPFREYDAELRFGVGEMRADESPECIAGAILQGLKNPLECPAFATRCTPEHPLGAPMVSSEGACAAYHTYGRTAAATGAAADDGAGRPGSRR
jgi:hydrogenase expression/formation protein HypD